MNPVRSGRKQPQQQIRVLRQGCPDPPPIDSSTLNYSVRFSGHFKIELMAVPLPVKAL